MNGNVLTIDLGVATALAAPGGLLQIGSAKVVAVNVGGTINAFTNVCPHEQQQVSQFTNGNLVCPTHDSVFNGTTGAFVEGPARTGLTKYTTSRTGTTVTITKS